MDDADVRELVASEVTCALLPARIEMGMHLHEILTAHTLNTVHEVGLQKNLGALEKGMLADFLVLENDWSDLFYHRAIRL